MGTGRLEPGTFQLSVQRNTILVSKVTGNRKDVRSSIPNQVMMFVLAMTLIRTLGLNQPEKWISRRSRSMKVSIHIHLVPRLRMRGNLFPLLLQHFMSLVKRLVTVEAFHYIFAVF
jgi:hypothetical protein